MRRWILAFDAGCVSCADLSNRISAEAGPRVEVAHLDSAEIRELRRRALGTEPPWVPTLLAVEDDRVRAWTGPALSLRLSRLLGPRRSLRVARRIHHADAALHPARRRFLKAIPGAAMGALILSGGLATPAAATGRSGQGTVSLAQAAQLVYGVGPGDLRITPNATAAAEVARRSSCSALWQQLARRLRAAGYRLGREVRVQKVEVPIGGPGAARPTLDFLTYEVTRGGHSVGKAYHVVGPAGEKVFAAVVRPGESTEVFADEGGTIKRIVFDRYGRTIASESAPAARLRPEALSCAAICAAICGPGAAGSVAECFAYCALTGAGEVVCTPLCAIIATLGCGLGCDRICSLL